MARITSCAWRLLKPVTTINKYNSVVRRVYNTSLGLPNVSKGGYSFYLLPGISVSAYVAYKASVKCEEEERINEDKYSVEDNKNETKPEKWTLYQFQTCPFCCKVRAFLDYYGIEYEKVEVNPTTRKEIKFQEYGKVPFIKSDKYQINDSSLVISVLKSNYLGKGDVGTLLTYYPFLEDENKKGGGEYQNMYNVMYQQGFTHAQNKAIREEAKWRRWIDEVFVHTLSPNIYRTMAEALQAMEYITKVGNFTEWERTGIYYSGAVAMYAIGKYLKRKYHLRNDVRASLYEEANRWNHNVGKKQFMGGKQPNLADLNMYGVISAIEGLDSFDDLIENVNIGAWYERMKKEVSSHRGRKDPDWLTLIK